MIFPIPALDDNYIWLLQESDTLVIIDPSESEPVIDWLVQNACQPTAILITHPHHDHIDGVAGLCAQYPNLHVYAHNLSRLIEATHPVSIGDNVQIGCFSFEVINLSGHTPDHIGYYMNNNVSSALFCGDALFSGGCGRLFNGGTAEQMTATLDRIAQFPVDTFLYPAHEYTLANLRFAQMVEPDNHALIARLAQVQALRQQGKVTLPTILQTELATNPFLRVNLSQVQAVIEHWANQTLTNSVQRFAQLRAWKDSIDRTGILELPA